MTNSWTALFLVALMLILSPQGALSRVGYGPGDQEWGHFNIRDGAHMFYWLFYSHDTDYHPHDQPLVVWLHGGPGIDSSGFANFAEVGPLHINGSERLDTWVNFANVLLIDSPVGTGYSYVEDEEDLATSTKEITDDLVLFFRQFFYSFPKLIRAPLYLVGESYSSKVAAELAMELHMVDDYAVNLQGVVLVSPLISPLDSVMLWAPILLHTGLIDMAGYREIAKDAKKIMKMVVNRQWLDAAAATGYLEHRINGLTFGVDVDNIFYKVTSGMAFSDENTPHEILFRNHASHVDLDAIHSLMQGPVRRALGIPKSIQFGSQKIEVFNRLIHDLMKPATKTVEELLNATFTHVTILAGQLDLLAGTFSTGQWVDDLKWTEAKQWKSSGRHAVFVDSVLQGYFKSMGPLSLFSVNKAGRLIAKDSPETAAAILNFITSNNDDDSFLMLGGSGSLYDSFSTMHNNNNLFAMIMNGRLKINNNSLSNMDKVNNPSDFQSVCGSFDSL